MLFIFSSCSYIAYKDYYSNIDDYDKIWSLTGFDHGYGEEPDFFPKNIDNLLVRNYLCRYDQQLPLGEGIQVFLEIAYTDDVLFAEEVKRISSMSFDCSDYFEESVLSAYATRLGIHYSSEYALIDNEGQIIYYIYLQNLPKNEIEIDNQLLPNGYVGYGEVVQQNIKNSNEYVCIHTKAY